MNTMKPMVSLVFVLSVITSSLLCLYLGRHVPAIAADRRPIKALQLQQTHYFFGEMKLTLTNSAVRVESIGQMRFVVVAKAPLWAVTVYRTDDKTRFDESFTTFMNTTLISEYMVAYRDKFTLETKIPKPIEFQGFKAVKLLGKKEEFVYLPAEKGMPESVFEIIRASYKMPTNGGIPLRFVITAAGKDIVTQLDETGQHRMMMQTRKIGYVTVPPDFFDEPVGYKKARSMTDVVISTSKRNESEDLEVMFSDTGSTKKSNKK
jgi:hypothetical protein